MKTHPSRFGVDESEPRMRRGLIKKLRNRYSKEQRKANDNKISHGVQVCELKKWYSNWS